MEAEMRKYRMIFILVMFLLSLPGLSIPKNLNASYGNQLLNVEKIKKSVLSAVDQLKKGNTEQAITLLSEAIMMIQNSQEFHIRKILLCSRIQGYRDYKTKNSNILQAGEPFLLYIEPAGYQIVKEDNDYKIWILEDAKIVNEKGEAVFEKTDWVNYNKGFPNPNIPFYITNRVADIPVGKYKFIFTLKDQYKKTFLTESFEFKVEQNQELSYCG